MAIIASVAAGLIAVSADATSISVADRLQLQNALFAQQWEADLRASPLTATAEGDNRFNAQLDHFSLTEAARQTRIDRSFLRQLSAIDVSGFPEEDATSHALLIEVLQQRIADYDLREFEMPVSQIAGIHLTLADLPKSIPLATAQDYENYLARLRQIPRAFAEATEVLKAGHRDGLMPPRLLLEKVPAECEGTIRDNPFLDPIKSFPSAVGAPDRARLSTLIEQAVQRSVLPAYRRFSYFVATDYAPHGRTSIAVASLPDGRRRYQNDIREQTSTDLTPGEVSALGTREVARLTGLLTDLAHREGFKDVASLRAALMADPRFKPTSADAIVADFRRHIEAMEPRLPEVFQGPQIAPLSVEAIPPSQPGNGTHYVPGTPDGSRPARIVIATSDYDHRSLIADETFAYHEGVPGHHVQLSIQQRLTGLPPFRRHVFSAAYGEGWAVYSETLAKEMGFFSDAPSEYGRLSTELLRAARLVVDPGIHVYGWDREKAVTYFRDLGVADEPTIQSEVDRYIAWPAQSLSYKVGQLKILELRREAQERLGSHFDIRAFHAQILDGGNLPLNLLAERVHRWLAAAAVAASPAVRPRP